MTLAITLDHQSQLPLHHQVYEQVRALILTGRMGAGQRLPSTRLLAESLGIARATVTESYDRLLSEGYIHTVPCSGTFVSDHLPEQLLASPPVVNSHPTAMADTGLEQISRYGKYVLGSTVLKQPRSHEQINFGFGPPAMEQLPIEEWRRLINHHCKNREYTVFGYSFDFAGHKPLREAIASYLSRSRALRCDAEQVIIVSGSQQALDLVSRVLIDHNDLVGVENPGYPAVRHTCAAQGARIVPLSVDNDGLIVSRLPEISERLKLVYVTPSHQYPTGTVMPLSRRLELLSWAAQNGTIVLEDDYNSEYRYEGRPLPALQGIDNAGCVFYTGTFSKVLFPAIRIGYLVVPHRFIQVMTAAKVLSDRQSAMLEQHVLTDFINEGHLERHVRKMRMIYERRRTVLLNALKLFFNENVSVIGQNAGMHVLARFRLKFSDEEIIARAKDYGVGISSSRFTYLDGHESGEFLLGYADMHEDSIREGIIRLSRALLG
ncbi:MAG TPA: PLP-dependent aminotransferase family protein [Candidatus Obscuribacterales bacterium]